MLRRLVTSSCRGHVDESPTGLFLLPHCEHGTAADRAEAAAVNRYFSSSAENISVLVSVMAPQNRLMLVK